MFVLVLLLLIFLPLFFFLKHFCLHGFSVFILVSPLRLSLTGFTLSLFFPTSSALLYWVNCSNKAIPPVLCPLFSHTREEMLFSKVPIQLSKGRVANTKSSKKLVSVHCEEKKKTTPNHPTPTNLKIQISRMGETAILWESINTLRQILK